MKTKAIAVILVFGLFLSSCESLIFERDLASTDPYVNFEFLYDEIVKNYAFFEYKDIDVSQLKWRHHWRLNNDMSEDSLFWVLAGMLNELRDGHVNLISSFNISRYPFQQLGPPNFNARLLEDNYLTERSYVTGPLLHDFIANGKIGYIRYSAFTNQITDENLDFVLNRYADTDGLIIDIRENGGGQTANGWLMLQRFIEAPTPILTMRTRNGPRINQFTSEETLTLSPHEATTDSPNYLKKVVVLIDRGSYSASSIFALGTKPLQHVVLVGDTTGGGTGLPNGGQLPNGWTYRMSISQTLEIGTGANFEDGVPPDIHALLNPSAPNVDEVVEAAIQFIQQ